MATGDTPAEAAAREKYYGELSYDDMNSIQRALYDYFAAEAAAELVVCNADIEMSTGYGSTGIWRLAIPQGTESKVNIQPPVGTTVTVTTVTPSGSTSVVVEEETVVLILPPPAGAILQFQFDSSIGGNTDLKFYDTISVDNEVGGSGDELIKFGTETSGVRRLTTQSFTDDITPVVPMSGELAVSKVIEDTSGNIYIQSVNA